MSAPASSVPSPRRASPGPGELRPLLRLAVPLVAGHAGSQLMSVVDTAMVGRLSAAALGGSGLAGSLWFTVTCLGLGLVLGAETSSPRRWVPASGLWPAARCGRRRGWPSWWVSR